MEIKENLQLTGFRKITESKDGAIRDIPPTWGGMLAMLLRKIVKDQYDGKGREGFPQLEDEKITFPQMEEIIEEVLQRYNNHALSKNDINAEKSRLLKEFSRDFISVKVFGEFLHILDLDWLDITVGMQRKSGTVKTYTYHIGGMGFKDNERPQLSNQYIQDSGIHEVSMPKPEPAIANYREKRGLMATRKTKKEKDNE